MDIANSKDYSVVRLLDGDDFFTQLQKLEIGAGVILSGIGMFRDVTLAFWTGTEYIEHIAKEPTELLSLQGNFSMKDGKPFAHCHVVLGLEDGSVIGGHLMNATVNETNEIVVKRFDAVSMGRQPAPSGLFHLDLTQE